jgi:hypothetical protein
MQRQWLAAHRYFTGVNQWSVCVQGSVASRSSLLEFGRPVKYRLSKIGVCVQLALAMLATFLKIWPISANLLLSAELSILSCHF